MTETATLTIRKAAIYIKNNERDMYTTPPRLVHSVTENTISMKKVLSEKQIVNKVPKTL